MRNTRTHFLNWPSKHTTTLVTNPADQILFFVRRFIQNIDWTYDLLAIIDKLIKEENDFTKFERMIVEEYLHFSFVDHFDHTTIADRVGQEMDLHQLLDLRDEIYKLAENYSNQLLKTPKMHPVHRTFKQVLGKVGYQKLSDEDQAILKEAYLHERNGQLFTLSGTLIKLPTMRVLWRLTG